MASVDTVGELGDCSLAGFPTEVVWGERTGTCRRSSGSAPISMRGVETKQLLTAFCLHGADAICFPRAVLHPGPSLSHTKIMCIFFCHHPAPTMDLLGGLDSCPLWRPGGCWQVQYLRSCSYSLSRAALSSARVPLGTVGLIFANQPNTRTTKQLAAQTSSLPGHLVKMDCRPTFNHFNCHQLSWQCRTDEGDVQHTVLAQAEPPSAPPVNSMVLMCGWDRQCSCRGTGGLFNDNSCSSQGRFVRCDSPAA